MIASLSSAERTSFLSGLTDREASQLLYEWSFWARPEQIPPPDNSWQTFLYLAGRGAGKTRSGAEWVRSEIESGRKKNIALVAPTSRDARKTIVEGESGILSVCPPWCYPLYEPSKLMLTWPNGGQAHLYSAEEPSRLRGPNHDAAWADELAVWERADETWSNLEMTLRGGTNPQRYITTTPRPTPLLRSIIDDPSTVIVRGSTFDNIDNLAPEFIARIREKYEGTRLGRQELYAELLEEAEGALWSRADLDMLRVSAAPAMKRVVVAIDPAVTSNEQSDETGIVVAGLGIDGHGYILGDLSGRYSPDHWARVAIDAYRYWQADRVIGEQNNGGDLIAFTLRTVDPNVSYKSVHASRGKQARAEPIAALYEQGRLHHVGMFAALEDQMTGWEPLGTDKSPDRLDAMVWAVTELMLERSGKAVQRHLQI